MTLIPLHARHTLNKSREFFRIVKTIFTSGFSLRRSSMNNTAVSVLPFSIRSALSTSKTLPLSPQILDLKSSGSLLVIAKFAKMSDSFDSSRSSPNTATERYFVFANTSLASADLPMPASPVMITILPVSKEELILSLYS